jgi:large subunit ribosomal protein L24
MKPTTVRNRTIYQASAFIRSKLMCGHLSDDLRKKYNKRSVRVTEGDTVKVLRGEFKGVSGKVTQVSTEKSSVAIEGIKKEKLKGGNLDIYIHTSNLLVTDLNTEDKWRINKLEGKTNKTANVTKTPSAKPNESKEKKEAKPAEKKSEPKESKESKATKKPAKEDK